MASSTPSVVLPLPAPAPHHLRPAVEPMSSADATTLSRPVTPAALDRLDFSVGHTYITITTHLCDNSDEVKCGLRRGSSHHLHVLWKNTHPTHTTEVRHGHSVVHAVNAALAQAFPDTNVAVKLHADLSFGDHHHPTLVEAMEFMRDSAPVPTESEWWWENGGKVLDVVKRTDGVADASVM